MLKGRSYFFVLKIFLFALALIGIISHFHIPQTHAAITGVPFEAPQYGEDVETWWQRHPLNPNSPNAISQIISPSNSVTLNDGDSIQNAVDGFSASGGTIYLNAGTYPGFSIIAKGNIHVIAKTTATIKGNVSIVGCQQALNYDTFNSCFYTNQQGCRQCFTNPTTQNIYFKNITFDSNETLTPVRLSAVKGILFDHCVFQGLAGYDSTFHLGSPAASGGVQGLWFRDSEFKGRSRAGMYIDGVQASGVIHSHFRNNTYLKDAAIYAFNNDDFAVDLNNNGQIDTYEKADMRYFVLYDNTFDGGYTSLINYAGGNFLAKKNLVEGPMSLGFALYNNEFTRQEYNYGLFIDNIKILENTFLDAGTVAQVDGATGTLPVPGGFKRASITIKDITIKDNTIGSFNQLLKKNPNTSAYDGPETITNNSNANITCTTSNGISNPSFENGLTSWQMPSGVSSDNVAHTGAKSAGIHSSGSQYFSQNTNLTAEKTYLMSAWTKAGSNSTKSNLRFAQLTPYVDTTSSNSKSGNGNWQYMTKIFKVPTGHQSGRIDMMWNLAAGDTLYADDVSMCQTNWNFGGTNYVAPTQSGGNFNWRSYPGPTFTPQTDPKNFFPYGLFSDNNLEGTTQSMQNILTDFSNHYLNSIYFANGNVTSQDKILSVSDQKSNFHVILGPASELNDQWWWPPISHSIDEARGVVGGLISKLKNHPSLKAYFILDDANDNAAGAYHPLKAAFNEADPTRPVLTTILFDESALFDERQGLFTSYAYPALVYKNTCDFFHNDTDWVGNIRLKAVNFHLQEQHIPMWWIFQTHGSQKAVNTSEGDKTKLREPTVEEVRLQHWLGLGEGVKGIFWFIYETQQFWKGLKDNPALYDEVGSLAHRIQPFQNILLKLEKDYNEKFTITAQNNLPVINKPYVSTLKNPETGKYYVIIANRSCQDQTVQIASSIFPSVSLKNLENNQTIALNQNIALKGGDGAIYEVVGNTPDIAPPTPVNLISNGSFESDLGGFDPSGSLSRDTSEHYAGNYSLKISGPAPDQYSLHALNIKPNTYYTLQYAVKASNVTGSGVGFRFVQTTPSVLISPFNRTRSTNGWKVIQRTFLTTTVVQNSRLDLQFDLKSGENAWIDDVKLCEGYSCTQQAYATSTPPQTTSSSAPTATPSVVCRADINKDNVVNLLDYSILVTDFFKKGENLRSDISLDGRVDLIDYSLLAKYFLKTCS